MFTASLCDLVRQTFWLICLLNGNIHTSSNNVLLS
ncbi:unnamed protein product [Phyllotreta striolata]|uniref:Uncharacterized protein n=1 Tax=Phyllotreta striolata TaxID=444603 RepID=A0A9N9TCU7_PHYSR|nr:unnamed protein product [Phyllotreta striolata]